MKLIQEHIKEIKSLCTKYSVDEMYVFRSVLNEKFSLSSDIDLLIRFGHVEPSEYFDNYMDFK